MRRVFGWLVVLGLFAPVAQAEEITVSAAVSLKEAFTQLARQFEQLQPGTKVVLNLGASGELSQQIARGAPVDVFASAGMKQVRDLGSLVISAQPFARNQLVVVVLRGQKPITKLQDLTKVTRLAMGNPKTVPVGQYAAAALQQAGIYLTLVAKQKLVYGENVRQVLAYVAGGDVDAGLVYQTDSQTTDKVTVSIVVTGGEPIIYPIAVVKDAKQPQLAQAFVAYVLSKPGQRVLRDQGFLAP